MLSLQEQYAPSSLCFGCGPSNDKGLRISSFIQEDGLSVCHWKAKEHHQAFPGMLCGGIIGSLLDCHSNWTAAYLIMKNAGLEAPLCTVTAEYKISLKRPTPLDAELKMIASATKSDSKKAFISAKLYANDELCAECEGLFVAVKEGHPAFHRWG